MEYKQESISEADLFEQISTLLNTPTTLDLLANFKAFLPAEQKDKYAAYVATLSSPSQ